MKKINIKYYIYAYIIWILLLLFFALIEDFLKNTNLGLFFYKIIQISFTPFILFLFYKSFKIKSKILKFIYSFLSLLLLIVILYLIILIGVEVYFRIILY